MSARWWWVVVALVGCGAPDPDDGSVEPTPEDPEGNSDSDGGGAPDSDSFDSEVLDSDAESADSDSGDSNSDSDAVSPDSDTSTSDTDGGRTDIPALTHFGDDAGVPDGVAWRDLAVDADGRLIGATSVGLLVFDGVSSVWSGVSDGLAADDVAAVGVAEDGEAWLGFNQVVGVDGQRLRLDASGRPTGVVSFDITRSGEISEIHRFVEQRIGIGDGDMWMGSNEGLCVFDRDLAVYAEHLHPTHPHLDTLGVAVTLDAQVWNGDQYQLSRWMYDHDGTVSSTGNLVEYGALWDAGGEPIEIRDLAADGMDVWVASARFGVARVDAFLGTTEPEFVAPDTLVSADAIEVDGDGDVWVGDAWGLLRIDADRAVMRIPDVTGNIEQLAMDHEAGVLWAAGSEGLWRLNPDAGAAE
jgi:ligand-binding sensor domain-containing protein